MTGFEPAMAGFGRELEIFVELSPSEKRLRCMEKTLEEDVIILL